MQINTNMASFFAQHSFNNNECQLTKTLQRLSSGVRINNAADDVAGLAIADRMTAQIRGMYQAQRNTNAGIALLQVADSALEVTGNLLHSIREIAVQAANASYRGMDRVSMQDKVNELLREINATATETKFNRRTLMDGSGGLMSSSADPDQATIIRGLRGSWLREPEARIQEYYGLKGRGGILEIKMEKGGTGGAATYVVASGGKMQLYVDMDDFNRPDSLGGFPADRIIAHEMVHAVMADNMDLSAMPWWFVEGAAEFIHGADDRVRSDFSSAADMVAALPKAQPNSSVEYSSAYLAVRFLHQQADGGIRSLMTQLRNGATFDQALSSASRFADTGAFEEAYQGAAGANYVQSLWERGEFKNEDTGAIGGADADQGAVLTSASVIPDSGGYSYDPLAGFEEIWPDGFDRAPSSNSFTLQIGENAGDRITLEIGATTVSALGLSNISVVEDAQSVIDKVDLALTYLNEQRGGMGAMTNRLNGLMNIGITNIGSAADARSRILDTDYAQETGELARRLILQRASQSMLVQANAAPRQVLGLLQW